MGVSNVIQVGAFYRSTLFDDVDLSGGSYANIAPVDFTITGTNTYFPAGFINNSTPAGWGITGTGGTDGINRLLKLYLAGIPEIDAPNQTIRSNGINGNPLSTRIAKQVRGMTVDVLFPKSRITQANYDAEWKQLQLINFATVHVWFLHPNFAALGYIDSDPKLFIGQGWDGARSMTLAFDYFYICTIVSGNRFYEQLRYT